LQKFAFYFAYFWSAGAIPALSGQVAFYLLAILSEGEKRLISVQMEGEVPL
jgi:hypothetical protein